MKVDKIITQQQEIEINDVTLLSIEEYEACEDKILKIYGKWWLRSPSSYSYGAAFVSSGSGVTNDYGLDVCLEIDVRPALRIDNLESSDLEVGDKFVLAEHTWTVISRDLALCDESVMKSWFRKDWKAKDANVYEASDVKKKLKEWADEHNILTKEGNKRQMDTIELKKYTINLYDLLGALIEYGQHDKRFKLGDIIKYDPVSVVEIAREFLDKEMERINRL